MQVVCSAFADGAFPALGRVLAADIGVDETSEVEGLVVRPAMSRPHRYSNFIGIEMALEGHFELVDVAICETSI